MKQWLRTNIRFIIGLSLGGVVIGGIIMTSRLEEDQTTGQTVSMAETARSDTSDSRAIEASERQAVVYRSTTCGCCLGYIAELKKQGFDVDVRSLREAEMVPIKNRFGLPAENQSCHTTVIGGFFIEGHVPMEAVEKLLVEKPAIDGSGLPGMPLGTPGMSGVKQAPYEVYQKKGNDFTLFMTI